MAENKVIIEVEIEGAGNAQKQLDKIENATTSLGDGVKGVGESFKGVGAIVSAQGGVMGEAFGALGDSVGGLVDGVSEFSEALQSGGKMGITSMLGLLGPISAIVGAIALAVEAWRQFSGAAKEAEQIEAAVTAAAGDLTSKMEELADKGIKPSNDELRRLIELNTQSRLGLEILNEKNANLTKVYAEQINAKNDLVRVTEKYKNLSDDEKRTLSDLIAANFRVKEADDAVANAQSMLTTEYEKALPAIQKAQEYQRNLAMTQDEALDALKSQLEAQKEYSDLLIETSSLSDHEKSVQKKAKELEIEQRLAGQRSQSVTQIQALTKVIEDENKARQSGDILALKEIKNAQEIQALKEAENKRLKDEARARSDAFKARQSQLINEQSQINALRIQLEKQGVDEQIALAVNTYTTQLALNKNNKNQLIIAELQYQQQLNDISQQEITRQQAEQASLLQAQNEKIRILQEEKDKEIAIEKEKAKTKKDLQDKIDLLDIQLTMAGNAQQVALLQKQMDMELAIVEKGSLEAIEIKKRYALAGKDLQDESIAQLKDFADAQAQSFSASVASAIMNGESIQATLKASLKGLATEALARSLYEGAAGLASLALGPVGGVPASQHFAASAAFAGVATVAGLAGASIPSATTGGAQGGASPTGMAQSPQIQRPEASKQEPLVFNMNFSGSTIYDTKESAKRAMSDEIVKYINEPRRGAPRLRVN
jgi:colicin import membrane protein